MNFGKQCRLFAAVVLLVPVLAVLMGARHMPRLEAPGDLAQATLGESILIDVLANDGVLGEGLVLEQVNRPLRGSAVIEDGQVRYTAGSSVGSDRFGYMVRLADGRKALGVVDVEVQYPQTGRDWWGLVPAHLGAGATVRLYIGDTVVSQSLTQADRRFSVFVPDFDYGPGRLAVVEVVGTTLAGVPARWYSVLDALDAIQDGWEGPGYESHWNLRVGPISTAHHALLSRVMTLPGGPAAQYRTHVSSVDPMMILRVATVFSMLAEGEVALPAGKADIYALIEDLAALDALVAALPADEFRQRQAALLSDRRMIQQYGFEPGQLFDYGYLMAPAGAGLMALATQEVAQLSPSEYTLGVPRSSNAAEVVQDEGWLNVLMSEPAQQRDFIQRTVQCTTGLLYPYWLTRSWDKETLVGLFRGADVSYMVRLRDVSLVPQPEALPPECVAALPGVEVVSEQVGALMYDWWVGSWRREGFSPGRHHLGVSTSSQDRTPRSGWVDVSAGAAGFEGQSLFASPWFANGWLLGVDLVDQQGRRNNHSATLVRQSAGAQEWVVRVDSEGGEGVSLHSTAGVNVDPNLGVVDFNGVWMNGPTTSNLSLGYPDAWEFLVALDVEAGTGWQISQGPGEPAPQLDKVWLEVGDTTLSAFAYRTSGGEFVGQCPPEDSGCTLWRKRDWQVLRVLHDHFGPGHHLMWVDERLRVAFIDGAWLADVRRVMPYMLTGDPVPDVADVADVAEVAPELAEPVSFKLEDSIGAEKGRMRH